MRRGAVLSTMLKYLYFIYLGITSCYCNNEFFRRDYKFDKGQQAFYKAHNVKQNFSDALATCKAEGSQLFLPTSLSEWTGVIDLTTRKDMEFFWVALHDIFSEGDFVALDGTSVDEHYINWSPGEPNNVNNDENCVETGRSGLSNDINCNRKIFLICKRELKGLTQNPDCETYDTEYKFVPYLDRCYKFHTLPMTWRDAYKICKAEESNLVVINSQDEANYLIEEFSKYPEITLKSHFQKEYIYVGFNDLINHGTYLTIYGQLLYLTGYENWAPSQPDDNKENEHCGSMRRNGELDDVDCKLRAMFVCEKVLTNSIHNIKTHTTGSPIAKLPDENKR